MLVRSLAMLLIPPPLTAVAHSKGLDMQSADNSAVLSARLRIDPGAIALHYEVKNTAGAEIFLFNQMYGDVDQQGRYQLDAAICNVEVQQERILISKKIPELPPNMLVEVRNIPCVTGVRPGAAFGEVVQLSLPLRQWTPYDQRPGRVRTALLPVYFQLGYFVAAGNAASVADKVPTTTGTALRFAPFSMSSQRLLTVGPFDPVQVFI